MRRTVPRFAGNCRRGPRVGSAAARTMRAGVSLVRQMSVEYQSGSAALTCTNGAGPSEIYDGLAVFIVSRDDPPDRLGHPLPHTLFDLFRLTRWQSQSRRSQTNPS